MRNIPTLEQFINESLLQEGKWSDIMKGVKSGDSGPWTIVATDQKKVVGQDIGIKVRDAIPAHFEEMKKKYPKAKLHIEDGGGQVVWVNESTVNENQEDIEKIVNKLYSIESEIWKKLNIRSGSQLYSSNETQQQYLVQAKKLIASQGLEKDLKKYAKKISDLLRNDNYHSLNIFLAASGYFGPKLKTEYMNILKSSLYNGWDASIFESFLNEAKIIYQKGKSYQTGNGWVVYADKSGSGLDIKVNNSAGWKLDPHDRREEDLILMDAGKQRAMVTFKEGNINAFAKKMWDMNDKTTWGEKQGLTADDYADILRVWIDMRNETRK